MKKFALILISFLVWSWPSGSSAGTDSQDSNAGKISAASSKNMEEQKKPEKEATVKQRRNKKTNLKDKEDCGCETTLFGEPVPQPGKSLPPTKEIKGPAKQTSKSSGKNEIGAKPATKSEPKEGTSNKTTQ